MPCDVPVSETRTVVVVDTSSALALGRSGVVDFSEALLDQAIVNDDGNPDDSEGRCIVLTCVIARGGGRDELDRLEVVLVRRHELHAQRHRQIRGVVEEMLAAIAVVRGEGQVMLMSGRATHEVQRDACCPVEQDVRRIFARQMPERVPVDVLIGHDNQLPKVHFCTSIENRGCKA